MAFSTTRHGGVSTGSYKSFNANHYCGDNPDDVAANRRILCNELGIEGNHLIVPHQTHKAETRIIDKEFLSLPYEQQAELLEGIDAVATDLKGVCVCVSTADCTPILIYNEKSNVICAIHAGWRGTVQRIVEESIKVLVSTYGINPNDCHAIIGPCISLDAFEVGNEVYEEFQDAGFEMSPIAKLYPTTNDEHPTKWHIDLPLCNRIQLINAGIAADNIHMSGICTYSSPVDFFSARRLGIKSGRILNGIVMH